TRSQRTPEFVPRAQTVSSPAAELGMSNLAERWGSSKNETPNSLSGRSAKQDTKKRPRRPGGRNGGSGATFPTRRPGGIHEMPPVPRGFETPAYWTVETGDRTGWGGRIRTSAFRNLVGSVKPESPYDWGESHGATLTFLS